MGCFQTCGGPSSGQSSHKLALVVDAQAPGAEEVGPVGGRGVGRGRRRVGRVGLLPGAVGPPGARSPARAAGKT